MTDTRTDTSDHVPAVTDARPISRREARRQQIAVMNDGFGREHVEFEYIKRRPRERGLPFSLLFIAAVVGVIGFIGWQGYRWALGQLDPAGEPGEEVVIALGEGATAQSIAGDLEAAGIIPNANVFQWYVRLNSDDGFNFQAGEYTFRKNSAAWDVKDVLSNPPTRVAQAVTYRLTIPPGLTVPEIAERIDENPDIAFTGTDYLAELTLGDHRSRYAPSAAILRNSGGLEPLEGLLFPETYFLLDDTDASAFVGQQLELFDLTLDELGYSQAEQLTGLTAYELVVLASLIEEEARVDEDRAKISRVIHNRLEAGWELGIDATVIYVTGDREITASDLATESPFNTRLAGNVGLPPTPIATPSRASLEAAIRPADGEWFYYVLTEPTGEHTFAVTDAEFQEAKRICQDRGLCG